MIPAEKGYVSVSSFRQKYLTNIWNVPNVLTIIRLVLVPVYVVLFVKGRKYAALITFLVALTGMLLLRIPHGPLWAGVVALVGAFPVLGAGTVLLPWSLICLLQGETARGIGLLGIYAAAALTRSILEPRLVGRQLGLDPLVTLFALYAGYKLAGLAGMLLAPMAAVTIIGALSGGLSEE